MVEIVVLKTTRCPNCPPVSALVKKVALDYGKVDVREVFLDKDHKEMAKAVSMGITTVPTILINGKVEFSEAPEEKDLRKAIERALDDEA